MVRTWIADIRPLYDEERYQMYYQRLPDFRKEKANRLHFQEDRARSAGVWTLLQMIRSKYEVSDDAVFNLSHSGDYVLCSVEMDHQDEVLVGCDIEEVKNARMNIARRFFSPEEYEQIQKADTEENQKEMFYRIWVLKESFMKATRQGMALDMKSFAIKLSHPPILLKKPDTFSQDFYYQEYQIPGIPYKMAACSTDKHMDSELWMEFKL